MTNDILLKKYKSELETLSFNEFTSETALAIGNHLIDIAKNNGYQITIDISRFNHQLFHFSFDGTTPDKDLWITRKRNVVEHFFTSSIYMATKLDRDETTLSQKYGLSDEKYAAVGGSVPIILKNVGVIGSITVAGLSPEEDHNLVISTIRRYLK
ncbi:heme-degrading domain-containing protein [Wukongibacter baidiensis]|uniref:heme-degrading domain-containing protein n=1 Tax=Wukongibacter baidiensis TaxID=1723361 RepID=UPI003D7F8CA4